MPGQNESFKINTCALRAMLPALGTEGKRPYLHNALVMHVQENAQDQGYLRYGATDGHMAVFYDDYDAGKHADGFKGISLSFTRAFIKSLSKDPYQEIEVTNHAPDNNPLKTMRVYPKDDDYSGEGASQIVFNLSFMARAEKSLKALKISRSPDCRLSLQKYDFSPILLRARNKKANGLWSCVIMPLRFDDV